MRELKNFFNNQHNYLRGKTKGQRRWSRKMAKGYMSDLFARNFIGHTYGNGLVGRVLGFIVGFCKYMINIF